MQPFGPLVLPSQGLGHRVVAEAGDLVVVALVKPNALPIKKIDGGDDLHGTGENRPVPSSRPPIPLPERRSSRLWPLALSLALGTVASPSQAFDLQFRQNNTNLSAVELQRIFSRSLPRTYERQFPESRWTTWLMLDAYPKKGMVAITLGLCPRLGDGRALLPAATLSLLEPLPTDPAGLQRLLGQAASRFGELMLANRGRIPEVR